MVARPGQKQAVFTAGELAPSLHDRRDLKYYFTGAKTMRNVEVLPQGGFRQAPRTRLVGKIPLPLQSLSIADATLTAPNGGIADNVRDGDATTKLVSNSLSGDAAKVLLTVDLGTPKAIAAVDVNLFKGAQTGHIVVQYQSGAAWIKLQDDKALAVSTRNRRFAAPPQAPVTAQNWRVVVSYLSAAGAIEIAEVAFWTEAAAFSSALRLRPFTASDGSTYDTLWQAGNTSVFRADGWVDSFSNPFTSVTLPELRTTQNLDTLLAFQKDTQPQRVMRQGADTEWQTAVIPFTNLPTFDYGEVYTNGVPAKWILEFIGFQNDTAFTLTVAGETTEGIKAPSTAPGVNYATLATSIKTALEATALVAAGISVAKVDDEQIEVVFTGTGNEGDNWNLSGVISLAGVVPVPTVSARKLIAGAAGVPAAWLLDFAGFAGIDPTGGTLTLTVSKGGAPENTSAIALPVSGNPITDLWTYLAPKIKTAIENLSGVAPGITVAKVDTAKIAVEFTGTGNEGDDWAIAGEVKNKADAAVIGYKDTTGVTPGEPIMSAARGWPRCGRIMQQRLLIGGLKGQPNIWLASATASYFDFDDSVPAATGAMAVPIDTDGNEAIEEIVATRSPLFLTSKAEYWLSDRAISKSAAPNHVQASRNGVAAGIPVEENEGAAIFVNANGGVVSEFRYNDVDQNYVTQPLSILASHLVTAVKDLALRRADQNLDANQLALVLDDGNMRLFTLQRAQDVTAGVRRETAGSFLACHVNGSNEIAVVTERTVDGAAQHYLERMEPGLLLDQAVTVGVNPAGPVVTGLADFEGVEVWAVANNDVLGPFTVRGGKIDLGQNASTVTVGRWTPPYVETLPLPTEVAPRTVMERRRRVHTVRISVEDTTSLAVGANNGKIYDVPLMKFGDAMGTRSLDKKFTGMVTVQGLTGFTDKPTVVITQKYPGTLNVRGIVVEAA